MDLDSTRLLKYMRPWVRVRGRRRGRVEDQVRVRIRVRVQVVISYIVAMTSQLLRNTRCQPGQTSSRSLCLGLA